VRLVTLDSGDLLASVAKIAGDHSDGVGADPAAGES
jgi:hypothetical protein